MSEQGQQQRPRRRRSRRRAIRRRRIILTGAVLAAAVIVLIAVIVNVNRSGNGTVAQNTSEPQLSEEELAAIAAQEARDNALALADHLQATYDYDGAVEALSSIEGFEEDEELQALADSYMAVKATCVPVKMEEVTHIFYHSLAVDSVRAFSDPEHRPGAVGHNQWMTTIGEFQNITKQMYDRGYVLVGVHDLVKQTTAEDGSVHFEMNEILLPPGKKAFVLSLDDLSYYHSYDGFGYANKMVVGENGKPMCEYTDAEGNTSIGPYDAIPQLDAFLEEHPDGCYHDARGIVALTGYNGILGYRTDESYKLGTPDLNRDKVAWLEAHPEFDLEAERAECQKVVDCIKADGWEFASHTWGHLRVGEISMSLLQADTQRWLDNVASLVGPTDTIIFAHGADLTTPSAYVGNERYEFLKSKGFNMFFNVDSNPYTYSIYDTYVHGGRRNLDGYRIYMNVTGVQNNIADLFDPEGVLDPVRPPVQPLG